MRPAYPAKHVRIHAEILRAAAQVEAVPVDGIEAEFFHTDFTLPQAAAPDYVRIFWAFSGDGAWRAPDAELSQLTLGRYRKLYKIYVLRQLDRPGETLENDACIEFLRSALPQMNRTYFPPS